MERLMIHSIIKTTQFERESSINYNLEFLSVNVFNISEAELSSTGTTSRIQKEVPQVYEL